MEYKKTKPITQEWLNKNRFRYTKSWSSKEDGEAYEARYPLHKYNTDTTVEARVIIYPQSGECRVDVLDANNYNALFATWYNRQFGNADALIDVISVELDKVIKKLGIKKNDNSRRKVPNLRSRNNKRKQSGIDNC